ncbi:BQ5605_C003g02513 [Microbotryum silenes-dioicae]|uniref:BQ5605_C003g02513 protein n=1 Tax=Microbotryum silenes-dioicae TaxID=796604 RepID=A0A2X0M5W4_9BASI|nr:BQ5605_C003g02513 [Microbotryum silenes-dioicae]
MQVVPAPFSISIDYIKNEEMLRSSRVTRPATALSVRTASLSRHFLSADGRVHLALVLLKFMRILFPIIHALRER